MSFVLPHPRVRSLTSRSANFLHLLLAFATSSVLTHGQTVFDWASGTIPTTVINSGATLNITTGASHSYTSAVTNNGTVSWQGGTLSSSGANFINAAGASFNDVVSTSTSLSGTGTFTNHGTYRKQGASTTTISQTFENNGSVIVTAGNLTLSGSGSASSAATYAVSSGATLAFNSQPHTVAGGAAFSGVGETQLNGGTLTLSSGTVSFSNLNFSSGTLGGAGHAAIGALTQSGGTLSASSLAISGASTWSSGNWNSTSPSTATIATGATLTASGSGVKDFNYRTITNQGTLNFTGGQLRSGNGGGIVNAAGATFNDSAGGFITDNLGGTATFTNAGTYNKTNSATSALSDVQMTFVSTGNVTVTAGTLQLSGGGNASGNITLSDASSRLKISSSNFEFRSGTAINGPGAIEVAGPTATFLDTITGNANLHLTHGTASVTGSTSLGGGTFSGGTFNGPGTLTLANSLGLSGTTLTGAGTINANGGVAITNSFSFNGTRSLNVSGASTWSGGYIYAGGGSTLTIKPSSTFTTSFDGTLNGTYYGGGTQSTVVENQGTFVKSAGTGTTDIGAVFNNAGLIEVKAGTLELSNGGNHTGNVTLSPGATLAFNGGNHTINSGAQINGTGNLRVAGGNATFSGANTGSANIVLDGGTTTFAGTTTTSGGGVFSGGTLTGAGTLTLGNSVTLSGTTLTGTGTLNANGGATLTSSFSLNGTRTLNLSGNSSWDAAYIYAGGGSVLNNLPQGNLTATGNGTLHGTYYGGDTLATVFNNQGNFTRSGATGETEITAVLNNTGKISVESGTLDLRGSGTNTGTVAISDGARVTVSAGTYTLASGTQLTGPGTLALASGNLAVSAPVTSSASGHFSGGTLEGSGTLTFTAPVTLAGSTLTGPGILAANAGASITSSFSLNGARTLTLGGASTWSSGYIYAGGNSLVNIPTGATFTTSTDSTLHGTYYDGDAARTQLNNQGTFTKTAGATNSATTITANVHNTGVINVQAGTLELSGGGHHTGTVNVSPGATFELGGGNHTIAAGAQINGTGNLRISSGNATFSGANTGSANIVLTGGNAAFNGTTTTTGGGVLSGGTLSGTGTLSLGNSVTLNGTTLTGAGTLNAQGGAALSSSFSLKGGRALNLGGASTWDNAYIYAGDGSTFTNQPGATLTTTGNSTLNGSYYGGVTTVFNNQGNFTRSGADGRVELHAPLHNTGTVNAQTGAIDLRGGGTNTGTLAIADGARIDVSSGAFVLNSGTQITGSGALQISGGTATVNTTVSSSGGGLFTSGTLDGPGSLSFSKLLTLAGTALLGTGNLHANGGAALTNSFELKNGQSLTLAGESTWTSGYIYHGSGSTLNNTGNLTTTHDGSFYHAYGGTPLTFNNSGVFKKSTGTGTTQLNALVHNTGTLAVESGTLDLRGGGSSSGPINVSAGAILLVSEGFTVANAAQVAGPGNLRLIGGTLSLTGSLGIASLTLDGGRLAGSHTLTTTTQWNSGDWNATAPGSTTTIASGATLTLGSGGNHDFNFRTIENLAGGTVTWHAGYLRSANGGAFVNRGNFYDKNSSSYTVYQPTDFGSASDPANTFRFVNHGTYTRDVGGVTTFQAPFDNHGTLTLTGGEIHLSGGGIMGATSLVNAGVGTHLYFTKDYTLAQGARFTGADAFFHTGGTLSIEGALQAPIFNWHGGNWNAATSGLTTSIASGTNLILDAGGSKDFNRRNITVDSGGTVTWNSGYLRAGNGSVFTNNGTFLDRNASSYSVHNPSEFGGSFSFVNRGTYTRDVGGVTTYHVPFENHGRVNLVAGEMRLQGGGTMFPTSVVDAATGAHLYFSSDYTLENGAQLTGPGSFIQNGGTLTINGALKAQSLHWSGGNWNAPSTVVTAATSAISAGPALTSIASGTLLVIDGGGNKDFDGRSITVDAGGTVRWESSYLRGGNGSVFTNNGTFQDRNSSSYSVVGTAHSGLGGTFSFVNNGSYVRDVGGNTYFTAPFENHGTLDLVGGHIELQGGGMMSATSVVNASTGTALFFDGDYTIAHGARFAGPGAFVHVSGTLAIDGTLQASSFNWSGGNWNAATSGLTTTIGSGSTLTINGGGNRDFDRRTLAIAPGGTLVWQSGYLRSGNDGAIVNQGTFHDQNSSSYDIESPTASGLGGNFTFTNAGTYNKTTHGTTQIEIPFTNTGTLNIHAGTMTFLGAFTNTGAINLANSANAYFPGALTFGASSPLGGTGTIHASSVTAAGLVSPGNSPGKLTISGSLTLLATSDLLIELAGAGQGTSYDFLNVGGTAAIAGDLQLSLLNGFRPALPTDTFTVLSSTGLTGAFANVANGGFLITADGGGMFRVNYGLGSAFATNSVVLSDFQAIPEPSTYALLALGALAVFFTTRRRR